MKRKPIILYVTPDISGDTDLAIRINILQRISLLETLGYTVKHVSYGCDFRYLLLFYKHIDSVIIRIDGSDRGKYHTLLKILYPKIRFIWEIHGCIEENFLGAAKLSVRYQVKKVIRLILSTLVDTCMYISRELQLYLSPSLRPKNHLVVTNFVSVRSAHYTLHTPLLSPILQSRIRNKFLVLWGGSPRYTWQAIDTIIQVAASFVLKDPSVLFVVVGRDSWRFSHLPNILFIRSLPRPQYISLVRHADICLALYHKPPHTPFYFFPLKILDYMYYGRSVIASRYSTIQSIITDKKNGILVSDSVAAVSRAIEALKNNPAHRKRIGIEARKTVLQLYTEQVAASLYKKILTTL